MHHVKCLLDLHNIGVLLLRAAPSFYQAERLPLISFSTVRKSQHRRHRYRILQAPGPGGTVRSRRVSACTKPFRARPTEHQRG